MALKAGGRHRRRAFIKQLSAGLGGLTLGGPVLGACRSSTPRGEDALFAAFRSPSAEARPFFRWWWNGNRVTRDELLRELRLMHEVGAGGVEINPIGMHEAIEDPPGRAVEWLSGEWAGLVAAVVDEAGRLGMATDLIVGTGWPFGGEFLRDDETIQGVALEVIDVQGPSRFRRTVPRDGPHHRLLQATLFPRRVRTVADGRDATSERGPDGSLSFDVPEGRHQVYLLTWRNRFRDVFLGAPGGAGPVLDHFNRRVVEKYLARTSDRLEAALGAPLGRRIRAMFCDSIELEGANWTGDLGAEFERRRGYDLLPWLPLVLHRELEAEERLVDSVRRVRFDYALTLAELFMERFIQPFHEWCRAHGVRSRYQAYGYPWIYTDLLEGYRVPDIPEGDQWLFNRGWVRSAELDAIRYAIWNKYASSAGHLEGRRIVSSEAMTNTRGVFEASLGYIKQATDIDVVGGINHLVLHGFNYSPPEAGQPGWMRFGAYFNEHNPWWPHARRWFDYAARLSQVFQDSVPVAEIAIMGPTPDVWSDHGLDRNPWNTTPWYLHALWQALNHHGYVADYVNGRVLREARFEDRAIHAGPMRYEALILTEVASVPPETAEALERYAAAGGRILLVGQAPRYATGLRDAEERDQRVRDAIGDLNERHAEVHRVDPPEEGALVERAGEWARLLDVEPAVRLEPVDHRLYFAHHRREERDVFFFANTDRERTLDVVATFPSSGRTIWRWDPETGEKSVFGRTPVLPVTLEPLESLLLVLEPSQGEPVPPTTARGERVVLEIAGPWRVRLKGMDGSVEERELTVLGDLSRLPGLEAFSGTAVYSARFEAPAAGRWDLDLGEVHEISAVALNGSPAGVRWYGRHRHSLDGVRAGSNSLEVTVTTLAFNHYREQRDNAMAQYWMDRTRQKEPLPSGLVGPVRLLRRPGAGRGSE